MLIHSLKTKLKTKISIQFMYIKLLLHQTRFLTLFNTLSHDLGFWSSRSLLSRNLRGHRSEKSNLSSIGDLGSNLVCWICGYELGVMGFVMVVIYKNPRTKVAEIRDRGWRWCLGY